MEAVWEITYTHSLSCSKQLTMCVKANNERKARLLANMLLEQQGYNGVKILECQEIRAVKRTM